MATLADPGALGHGGNRAGDESGSMNVDPVDIGGRLRRPSRIGHEPRALDGVRRWREHEMFAELPSDFRETLEIFAVPRQGGRRE
jgi:hypothetical protein